MAEEGASSGGVAVPRGPQGTLPAPLYPGMAARSPASVQSPYGPLAGRAVMARARPAAMGSSSAAVRGQAVAPPPSSVQLGANAGVQVMATAPPAGEEEGEEDAAEREEDVDGEVENKKRKMPLPLSETHLVSNRGLPRLAEHYSSTLGLCNAGQERRWLFRLLETYKEWGHNLYPRLAFQDLASRVESLGSKQRLREFVREMRDEHSIRHLKETYGEEVCEAAKRRLDHAAELRKTAQDLEGGSSNYNRYGVEDDRGAAADADADADAGAGDAAGTLSKEAEGEGSVDAAIFPTHEQDVGALSRAAIVPATGTEKVGNERPMSLLTSAGVDPTASIAKLSDEQAMGLLTSTDSDSAASSAHEEKIAAPSHRPSESQALATVTATTAVTDVPSQAPKHREGDKSASRMNDSPLLANDSFMIESIDEIDFGEF